MIDLLIFTFKLNIILHVGTGRPCTRASRKTRGIFQSSGGGNHSQPQAIWWYQTIKQTSLRKHPSQPWWSPF